MMNPVRTIFDYLRTREERRRLKDQHRDITATMLRAPDDELKHIYNETEYKYDPKFAEAVMMCLEQQEKHSY